METDRKQVKERWVYHAESMDFTLLTMRSHWRAFNPQRNMIRVGALDRFPRDSENERREGDKNRGHRTGVWVRRWAGSVTIQARDKEAKNQAGAVRNIGRIKLIRL